MKYIYKTVSLAQFLDINPSSGINWVANAGYLGHANKAAEATELLLNKMAEDGWEFVKLEEIEAEYFKKDDGSFLESLAGKAGKYNPSIVLFIFKQEFTQELQLELDKEKRALEERASTAGIKLNGDGTWTCPRSGHQNPLPLGKCAYCGFDANK